MEQHLFSMFQFQLRFYPISGSFLALVFRGLNGLVLRVWVGHNKFFLVYVPFHFGINWGLFGSQKAILGLGETLKDT